MVELCDLDLADAEGGRLLTRRKIAKLTDRGRIARHIKPILGRIMVVAVTTHAFPHRGVATRTVALAIFTYAFRKEFRADNPVRGVMRFADSWRERRLTDEECSGSALGTALENAAIEDSDRR